VTDAILVLQKLTTLREHAERVRRRRPTAAAALRTDVDLQDALAMSLLVAVQEAIDIAFHIAADEGWGIPASYADGFATLARRGVIDATLADALARAVSVRNRIAHGYGTLDVDRIWSELPAGLEALDRYATAIARFLPPATG
jgi:uncharacterized protein YutE (UPF0331/DUF86 family)